VAEKAKLGGGRAAGEKRRLGTRAKLKTNIGTGRAPNGV
jgi:hypothetical protein